ncbi:MAG TPA: HAD family hydrolase [Gemmatimonadota bacterium]|nr:HAD family hydrolase [Gemmatimonadota bacterium]
MTLVVLDAAGTLIEVRGSVGEAYAEAARAAGAELDPARIEAGFARAWPDSPPLAFGGLPPAERRVAERAWWRDVARRAVAAADPPSEFDFDAFFDRAWERFAQRAAWRIFPDVGPALRALRRGGFPLAVFSNWDGRLPGLLDAFGLGGFFARVRASADLPAAKPAREAFDAVAAELAGLAGGEPPVLVGDRLDHDVEPALAAGWRAVWLDRGGLGGPAPDGAVRIADLSEVPAALAAPVP